mmetsp:Transcript_106154/g.129472  ORF Transcript_106154/g.129472 Transcript_106154/m.129472 type:complete len:132 (-) Transcript_106154:22-417(-)
MSKRRRRNGICFPQTSIASKSIKKSEEMALISDKNITPINNCDNITTTSNDIDINDINLYDMSEYFYNTNNKCTTTSNKNKIKKKKRKKLFEYMTINEFSRLELREMKSKIRLIESIQNESNLLKKLFGKT